MTGAISLNLFPKKIFITWFVATPVLYKTTKAGLLMESYADFISRNRLLHKANWYVSFRELYLMWQ